MRKSAHGGDTAQWSGWRWTGTVYWMVVVGAAILVAWGVAGAVGGDEQRAGAPGEGQRHELQL